MDMACFADGRKLRRSRPLILTAAMVLILDQVSKSLIRAHLELGEFVPTQGRFRLTYATNEGSIFGLALDPTLLLVAAVVIIGVIGWAYFRYLYPAGALLRTGLGLILGGAIGNLIDRIRFGEVTDFIAVHVWGSFDWPAFNVADAALSCGIVIVLWRFLREANRNSA